MISLNLTQGVKGVGIMERKFKKLFSLAVLLSTAGIVMAEVAPFLSFRSAGRNTARKLVGTTSHHVYLYDMESFYGTFFITPTYERSLRPRHIAECLFGEFLVDASGDGKKGRTLKISGSQVANRADTDLMAENFFLARDFESTITVTPRIQNFLVDFHFHMGLDEWVKGLYFRVYGPVVHARYDLDAEEEEPPKQPGTIGYAAGFFGPAAVPAGDLLKTASAFFTGNNITVPGIEVKGLNFAKIKEKKDRNTCFAELRGELGWNFVLDEDYHFGVNIQAAAPTGDRPNAEFLFESQCGNGKHWELGGGVTGHYTLWRSEDEEKHFDFVIEADVTHMFKAKQKRTFDLKKGTTRKPLSRYMLAQRLGTPVTKLFARDAAGEGDAAGAGAVPNAQFKNEFVPVANFSTRDIKVDVNIQGDVVAMFNFTSRGFSWDFGYNFWGRGCEDIELRDKDGDEFKEKTWALKGDARVFGFAEGDDADAGVAEDDPIALSATQSDATITRGTNLGGVGNIAERLNAGISNRKFAATGTTNNAVRLQEQAQLAGNDNQQGTSNPAVFITKEDLDLESAETRGMSHKVFTHFNYTWVDREDWIPYVGFGGEAEFGKSDSDTKKTDSTSDSSGCLDCAVSKWSVWVKGGLSFD